MDSDTAERFVFDIKRFALHDGPGIRTTAFLKGCPLSCTWCHNPEGLKPAPLIWYSDSQCIRCWQCVKTCPPGALTIPENENGPLQYDREKCIHCGECVKTCPSGALRWDSRQYTVSELTDELLKDEIFHKSSGGGITISGGEPMNRPNFALKVLEACQAKGTHTAIETSLYAARETVDRFLPFVNLFLADLKLIDDETHRNCTGVGNKRIMENLAIIAQSTAARSTPEQPGMIVRVPLIPGITDTEKNIAGIAQYVSGLEGNVPVELLNFNPLAESKYRSLGLPYILKSTTVRKTEQLSTERIEVLKSILREEGCRVL